MKFFFFNKTLSILIVKSCFFLFVNYNRGYDFSRFAFVGHTLLYTFSLCMYSLRAFKVALLKVYTLAFSSSPTEVLVILILSAVCSNPLGQPLLWENKFSSKTIYEIPVKIHENWNFHPLIPVKYYNIIILEKIIQFRNLNSIVFQL